MQKVKFNSFSLQNQRRVLGASLLGLILFFPAFAKSETMVGSQSANELGKSNTVEALPENLTEVGLEKLLSFDIEVTTASKKKQKISEIASAVYVITKEDIKRSPATHVAELLRVVPGLSVARITGNQWAITARGFNNIFANKLLVLIDGQRVFNPIFNGVLWDELDLALENIERIEVIRGPGAALWGSNAANGVINIITVHARDAQGGLVSVGGGNQDKNIDLLRYGGKIGSDSYYQAYGKFSARANNSLENDSSANDRSNFGSAGMRFDSELSQSDALIFKTDVFSIDKQLDASVPSLSPPYIDQEAFSGRKLERGVSILGRWSRNLGSRSDLDTQFDYAYENQTGQLYPVTRHTLHLESQHRLALFEGNDLIYGAEYQFHHDRIFGNFADDFEPDNRSTQLFAGFFHDEVSIVDDTLKLIFGSKLEHNDHTGVEFMPNVRLWWAPDARSSVWAAVSKAVATPSRVFEDVRLPLAAVPVQPDSPPALLTMYGQRSVESESFIAYETGYRRYLSQDISADVALFFNDYDDLSSLTIGNPFVGSLRGQPFPTLIIPAYFGNDLRAHTYGTEMSLDYKATDWISFFCSYSFIKINVIQGSSQDTANTEFYEGGTPQNQFTLRSAVSFSDDWQADALFRYVDDLLDGEANNYSELDLRLGWKPTKTLDVSLSGLNLLHASHLESRGKLFPPPTTEINRGVFARVTYTF